MYGSNAELQSSMRVGARGLMATLDILPDGLKPLLPLKVRFPDDGCTRPARDIFCFLAGEYTSRVIKFKKWLVWKSSNSRRQPSKRATDADGPAHHLCAGTQQDRARIGLAEPSLDRRNYFPSKMRF